jgi:hypothetical protein
VPGDSISRNGEDVTNTGRLACHGFWKAESGKGWRDSRLPDLVPPSPARLAAVYCVCGNGPTCALFPWALAHDLRGAALRRDQERTRR